MDYLPGQKINCRSGEVTAIKNTGSNFQHPPVRGHSRSCSLNRNEPSDAMEFLCQ